MVRYEAEESIRKTVGRGNRLEITRVSDMHGVDTLPLSVGRVCFQTPNTPIIVDPLKHALLQ